MYMHKHDERGSPIVRKPKNPRVTSGSELKTAIGVLKQAAYYSGLDDVVFQCTPHGFRATMSWMAQATLGSPFMAVECSWTESIPVDQRIWSFDPSSVKSLVSFADNDSIEWGLDGDWFCGYGTMKKNPSYAFSTRLWGARRDDEGFMESVLVEEHLDWLLGPQVAQGSMWPVKRALSLKRKDERDVNCKIHDGNFFLQITDEGRGAAWIKAGTAQEHATAGFYSGLVVAAIGSMPAELLKNGKATFHEHGIVLDYERQGFHVRILGATRPEND